MPPHERLGSDDMKHLEDGWKQSIELDKHPPIEVGQTNPAPALAPQHEQLVPQDRILGLKPRVRSTRRDQDGQNRPEEPDHPISLRPPPQGMRFSVQTGVWPQGERNVQTPRCGDSYGNREHRIIYLSD